jgi:hypothetical protein
LLFAIFFALVVLFWLKSASETSGAAIGETEISTETLEKINLLGIQAYRNRMNASNSAFWALLDLF